MQIVTVNQAPAPASSGRRLAQAASPSADNITASLSVASQQNVQVNLTVAVPFQDRNNVTAIVQDAINSGQVRRGLQESGMGSYLCTGKRLTLEYEAKD